LPWHQPHERCELPTLAEGSTVADSRHDGGGDQWADAWDGAQPSARGVGGGDLFNLLIRSLDLQVRLVYVLYFDTDVQKVETYQAGQPVKLAPVGGGGTDFRPCFRWLEERGITPQTLLFLTDLWGTFPGDVPPYPVLWASTGKREAPFGLVIPMEAE
jgi:hypothetical protein